MIANKNKQKPDTLISIVVPSFREEKYIEKTLTDINTVLRKLTNKYEIICVVDGIVDDTYKIAESVSVKYKDKISVVAYEKNRGKGYALRVGFKKAVGKYIGFIDADGQINESSIAEAFHIMKNQKADIVMGSKKHSSSRVNYSLLRKSISFFSQIFIKLLFGLGVSDTQAGIKLFRREVIKAILPKLKVNRFAFDIEALSVAKYLGYHKFIEFPITVKMLKDDNSNINSFLLMNDVAKTLKETLAIVIRLRILGSYRTNRK